MIGIRIKMSKKVIININSNYNKINNWEWKIFEYRDDINGKSNV